MALFKVKQDGRDDGKYTKDVKIPHYKITRNKPVVASLYNPIKSNQLIAKIRQSGVTEEEKEFLINAARRHIVFNYGNIAEYYAHADKEMQELMEESALVIVDIDDAIANGYVQLSKRIQDLMWGETDE